MFYSVVTADEQEVKAGDLDSFLSSIDPREVRIVLVLRAASSEIVNRYRASEHVWHVIDGPVGGLSTIRNTALRYLDGKLDDDDVISFPDDDCRYPKGLIFDVSRVMTVNGADVVVGRYGESPKLLVTARKLSTYDALYRSSSVCMFVMWKVVRRVGGFNEALGVGSHNYAFGEDNDFALRVRRKATKPVYDDSIFVWHLEERPTTGRNPKGYLVSALLNLESLSMLLTIARGIAGAVVQDLISLPREPRAIVQVGAALHPMRLARAWAGKRVAAKLFR